LKLKKYVLARIVPVHRGPTMRAVVCVAGLCGALGEMLWMSSPDFDCGISTCRDE